MKFWRIPFDAETITIPQGQIHLIKDRCKGCGFCVEYCPRHVLELSDEFNVKGYHPPVARSATDCVDCRLCEVICPEFAIFIETKLKNQEATEAASKTEELECHAG